MAGKAKELAELNRLNGQIHAQQNKADKIYMEIGKVVYENRADWENIDINARLELLDSIWKEISDLERHSKCGGCSCVKVVGWRLAGVCHSVLSAVSW